MSSAYVTEQQQIEQLKLWWKNHGTSTLIVFIIVFAASIGWRFWLHHREDKLERASSHYETLLSAVVNEDQTNAVKEADLLKNNYKHTPYAALAMLMLARNDVYTGNYQAAQNELNWVMKHGSTNSLKQIARLRLARIQLQLGQPQQSLDLLDKVSDASYAVIINELKGDSYLALKQPEQARQWYQKALTQLPDYAILRPILRMKLDDLAPVKSQNTQGA